jgi:ferric-dicitrate binding protein FerR (iron transport regulator)
MKKEVFPLSELEIDNAHRVAYLIAGYIHKTLTPAEQHELDEWVGASERNIELFEELTDEANLAQLLQWRQNLDTEASLQRLKSRLPKRRSRGWSLAIAASLLAAVAIGSYLFFRSPQRTATAPVAAVTQLPSVARGTVRLTTGNGQSLTLTDAADGKLDAISEATVIKEQGALAYEATGEPPVYHTLATGAGSQYRLALPDGTLVWLNAGSSLRFPTAFSGDERRVELSGEAYFEVAKDAAKPFRVQSGHTTTEVLGTHFNVRAYAGENGVTTTLLEGSVKVFNNVLAQQLKPGQQARINEETIELALANGEEAIGWKNGRFVFHKTPVAAVLQELERWYGMPIENKEGSQKHLTASFSRSLPLPKVLRLLEATGDVQFRTTGNEIRVIE